MPPRLRVPPSLLVVPTRKPPKMFSIGRPKDVASPLVVPNCGRASTSLLVVLASLLVAPLFFFLKNKLSPLPKRDKVPKTRTAETLLYAPHTAGRVEPPGAHWPRLAMVALMPRRAPEPGAPQKPGAARARGSRCCACRAPAPRASGSSPGAPAANGPEPRLQNVMGGHGYKQAGKSSVLASVHAWEACLTVRGDRRHRDAAVLLLPGCECVGLCAI